MKSKIFLLLTGLILLFLLVDPLFGSDVSVDYLEGYLSYRVGSGQWLKAGIGDNLSSNSTIRISGEGFAELSSGESKITITRDGMYEITKLFGNKPAKTSFRKLLGSKFSFLLNRSDSANYTAAAVRGAARGNDFLAWQEDGESNLVRGLELYNAGNYVGARNQFKEGSLWEKGAEKRENIFRLAMSENMIGNPRESRSILASLEPRETDPFFEEYSLYTASLYIESQDYDIAENILQKYLNTNPDNDGKQAALLLMAYSYDGQDRPMRKKESLQQLISLDSNTNVAKSASVMLK